MPELPEVETVRLTLQPALGATIASVWSSGMPLRLARPQPRGKYKRLVDQRITSLRRLGKYLLVDTQGGDTLLVHLGMSGRFRLQQAADPTVPHTHAVFRLADGRELRYSDPRRFGQLDVLRRDVERSHPALAVLGPDPIAEGIPDAHLFTRSRGKHTPLKTFILDQSVLAGIGNIYASEALWKAKLVPTKPAHRLTKTSAQTLSDAIMLVLRSSLQNHGTSLRDFVNPDAEPGSNANYLWVYGKDDSACPVCSTPIRRTVLAGRATFHCRRCQR